MKAIKILSIRYESNKKVTIITVGKIHSGNIVESITQKSDGGYVVEYQGGKSIKIHMPETVEPGLEIYDDSGFEEAFIEIEKGKYFEGHKEPYSQELLTGWVQRERKLKGIKEHDDELETPDIL